MFYRIYDLFGVYIVDINHTQEFTLNRFKDIRCLATYNSISIGPSIDPCGTPQVMFLHSEACSQMYTHCFFHVDKISPNCVVCDFPDSIIIKLFFLGVVWSSVKSGGP